ncbi:hypothetical protein OHT52_30130 [Streptomyces sp. NBC_00247]|uniref:hypothetical protein n=1 Tax=Streptomyces sp. NBC_00247 TaxID=2975689 RepID=UPI002E280EE5|nr:hypothetical protein [Streptomyces sp. NBC_00247]
MTRADLVLADRLPTVDEHRRIAEAVGWSTPSPGISWPPPSPAPRPVSSHWTARR